MRIRRDGIGILRFLWVLLLGLSLSGLNAQDAPEPQEDTVRYSKVDILNADFANYLATDTASFWFLKGNIELTQDSIFMKCDSAVVINDQDVRAYGEVVIQKGDSLSAIAKRYYGDAKEYPRIFDANREVIKDPDLIYPGQKIRVPLG